MKRTKFIVDLRNKLSELAMSFDSAACINDGGMTESEREDIQGKLRKILEKIDKEILPKDERK